MQELKLLKTGVANLDTILGGGFPVYSLNIIGGLPGTGKTILAQQIVFNHIKNNSGSRALYVTTLSEPTVKVVRYMQHFSFFNGEVFGEQVIYKDLGNFIRKNKLQEVANHILELVEELRPSILVIDSFKAIRDLTEKQSSFRQFCYELSIRLASARCTSFLIGEFSTSDIAAGAEFAVGDGIIYLNIGEQDGEQRRFLQVHKLRGRNAQMDPFPFFINVNGIKILSPALTLRQHVLDPSKETEYISSGIEGLDALLQNGFSRGRALILSGVSGTGKTTLALQFLIYGAKQGQKGLFISFEETKDRIHRMMKGFGWDLDKLGKKGLIRVIYIAQTDIQVEKNLENIIQEFKEFQPVRFVVDSFSVFLHKVTDPAVQRDKAFQFVTLIQKHNSVGLLISDIAAGDEKKLSRFGVEETVVDGTIVLSSELSGHKRKRYIEVYKLRASKHVSGRHRMEITPSGIEVFYFKSPDLSQIKIPPPLEFTPTKGIFKGNLPFGSAWLIQGDPGIGKSTLAYQFAIEGLRRKEAVLFIAVDSPLSIVRESMQNFGFLIEPFLESGQLIIIDLSGYGNGSLDPSDPEKFLLEVVSQIEEMPKPLRVIIDSLSPIALDYSPNEFIKLIHRKNKLLRRPNVCVFDSMLRDTLRINENYRLVNAFEIYIDLYTPDWGEMTQAGKTGIRSLQVKKSRGVASDMRPYPYTIGKSGIVVQKNFYRLEGSES